MDVLSFDAIVNNVGIGLSSALTASNLFYAFLGVTLGMFFGVLPGIGALVAMSLLFPLTFHLEPTAAIIMLAGIYYGSAYGGSVASILVNLPGEPSSAVTCLDGYPMSKQGRAGVALFMTTIASFFGASVGILLMTVSSPVIAVFAMNFGAWEYFSLMVLGLVAASTVSANSPVKGLAMVVLGVSLGVVGTDVNSGSLRFTFGLAELHDGISILAVAMGIFGVSEVISSVRTGGANNVDAKSITLRSLLPTRDEVRRSWLPMVRGSAIGSFFGALPGTGGMISSFMSYAVERRVSKQPERFGKGAIEGIVGPEAANNAADQTSFIPTMALGIPGKASMALIVGVLIIHGLAPGPQLMIQKPELFWGLVMSFWIGNLMLLVLNIPLVGLWVRLLTVPYHLLYPAVLVFVCVGVYTVAVSAFSIWMVALFGVVGYFMRLLDFPLSSMLLGFVLGPMLEENLRRGLLISNGDFLAVFNRPVSAAIMASTCAIFLWLMLSAVYARRRRARQVAST